MSSELYVEWEIHNEEYIQREMIRRIEAERQRQEAQFHESMRTLSEIRSTIEAATSKVAAHLSPGVANSIYLSNIHNNKSNVMLGTGYDIDALPMVDVMSTEKRVVAPIDASKHMEVLEANSSDYAKKRYYAQLKINSLSDENSFDGFNEAKIKLVKYINLLLADNELCYNDFEEMVDRRCALIEESERMNRYSKGRAEDIMLYNVLCSLQNDKSTIVENDNLDSRIATMREKYFTKLKSEYVIDNLVEVFEESGIVIDSNMTLNGLRGSRLKFEDINECSVFMCPEANGIIFETVADSVTSDTIRKQTIEKETNDICRKHAMIIEKMRERGITMKVECEVTTSLEGNGKMEDKTNRAKSRLKSKAAIVGE